MQRYKLMTFLPTQDKKGRGKKPVATPKAALHCCHKVRRTAAAKAESNLVAHTPPTAFDIHKEREPFFPQSFISGVKDQKRIPAKSVFQRIVDTASNSSGA